MDIKKFATDTWTKAKDYAVEHKNEIGTIASNVAFGLGMATMGMIAGMAIEDRKFIHNMQVNELVKSCTAAKADGTWSDSKIYDFTNEIKK